MKKSDKIIKLTKNPYGFINNPDKRKSGIVSDTIYENINKITNDQFLDIMKSLFKDNIGINVDYTVEKHTALPNDEDTFMRLFYDETTENIKNINLFKINYGISISLPNI